MPRFTERHLARDEQGEGIPRLLECIGGGHRLSSRSGSGRTGRSEFGGKRLSVVRLSLDKFREFNDANDCPAGDEMMMHVAKVLYVRAGVDGFVARRACVEAAKLPGTPHLSLNVSSRSGDAASQRYIRSPISLSRISRKSCAFNGSGYLLGRSAEIVPGRVVIA